jgi:uncharacterized membrane protein
VAVPRLRNCRWLAIILLLNRNCISYVMIMCVYPRGSGQTCILKREQERQAMKQMSCRRSISSIPTTIVFFILVSMTLTAGFSTAGAKSYYHPVIEQIYRLNPDGSANVEEIRTFRFDGSFSWAFLFRETRGEYGTYRVEYEGVWDADTNEKLRSEVSSSGRGEMIKWHYSAENTTKRFLIRYRIEGAVQRYRDAAQFYWKAIEDEHAPINFIAITVFPPEPSPGLFKVFVHSAAAPGEIEFSPDFQRASVQQDGISKDSFVELRVLLDQEIFPVAQIEPGQSYESLLEDERAIVDASRSRATWNTVAIVVSVIVLVLFIAAFVWVYIRYGREPRVDYDVVYEREPPRDMPPAVVPAILTQGNVHDVEIAKSFAATIIECARLGYLEIHEGDEKGVIFKKREFIYKLTLKGEALLAHRPVELDRGERVLEEFEVEVLRTVIEEAGDGSRATGEDIEKWGKKTRGGKSNFLRFVKPFGKKLRAWFERTHFQLDDPRSKKAQIWFITASVLLAALFILSFFLVTRNLVNMITGALVLALLPFAISLARWTKEAALEEKRWKAYRKFISDFSAMKDAGPGLLQIWEQHLVYATALGVADKLLANLDLVAKEFKSGVPAAVWFHPYGAAGGRGPGGTASLQSLGASFANLANLSSALSSSTSSGGGFSGGGGGGGGGGASGAG